jgi:hypothetical protein
LGVLVQLESERSSRQFHSHHGIRPQAGKDSTRKQEAGGGMREVKERREIFHLKFEISHLSLVEMTIGLR